MKTIHLYTSSVSYDEQNQRRIICT